MRRGMAGRLAAAFIDSKRTPLFLLASLALGLLAVVAVILERVGTALGTAVRSAP